MTGKPPLKLLSLQEWEILIDDFQYGGERRRKWMSQYSISSFLDLAVSSIVRKEFPLKIQLIIFIEEFSDILFSESEDQSLDQLLDALRVIVQSPIDNILITYALKEQFMVSATSIFISIHAFNKFPIRFTESLVELLLTIINRPNHGLDRHSRAIACECLRELERSYPCLLSDIAGHLWSLCQSERTHASQSYILLFTMVIYNVVSHKWNVSILNTSGCLIPFSVPNLLPGSSPSSEISGLNYKELRRAMAFLLEWQQVLTPSGMMEFMALIIPVAVALELQASMLKVQFFGMIYSYNPMLCHVVLMMYSQFFDALDGQEGEISHRLILISREVQQFMVFRLLALHWLLGFSGLMLSKDINKMKLIVENGSRFYPTVFDPLALKALKLDLLAFCSTCIDIMKQDGVFGEKVSTAKAAVKLFQDGITSVSAYKWLPPWSSETGVSFRTFHKFLIGASSHSDTDSATTKVLMESTMFHTLQGMLVDLMLEFRRLVPVVVALVDRLLGCQKHCWLGERLLQTFDEHLLPKLIIDYTLVSYFPILDRIAENDTIPPYRLLELLTKFMDFLVEKHGPDTGLRSWSQGSKVLGLCHSMLMHHHSSRLFIGLSRLLAFTCLYFPDLEVRDNARIYLRMLICIPGKKLREMLHLGEQLLGISPSPHASSFFSVQSPRSSHDFKKYKNISSYVHLKRVIPLLVKQSWSLSLSTLGIDINKPSYVEDIQDSETQVDERGTGGSSIAKINSESERRDKLQEPLRVMDSKISEILGTLRKHFSCIPDYRHMPGLKVGISCSLGFESEPFNRIWGVDSANSGLDAVDTLPAIYATVLKFSSSAPYGFIQSYHIPFLLGEPPRNNNSQKVSLEIGPVDNGFGEDESYEAPVMIELEPQEPTPGLVDVLIDTNAENGQIIRGQLQSITVGIEDMFLKAVVPDDTLEDAIPSYYSDLFSALWEAMGTSSNLGRETFPLKGGKGVAAISGTQSVKLLEVPLHSVIHATERYLAPFVVSVIGEPLVNVLKDGGIIRDIIWKDVISDSSLDLTTAVSDFDKGPLRLKYIDDNEDDDEDTHVNIGKRNLGSILILIFLPPRYHLLFQMEVSDISTLVRIRTDHWPCLAYIDDYLEALFLA